MNKSINLTIIEYLPNELFFEIFQYINTYDLHNIWSKLNKRFKNIIDSISMYAHIITKDDYKNYESYFYSYTSKFIYIRIEDICETFNISLFTNIHSLHLSIITDQQFDQITPENLPYLTHLTIKRFYAHHHPAILLFGSKQFQYLKTCQLPYLISTNSNLQPCFTLRSLRLHFCSSETFIKKVLKFLPNLIYFESITRTDVSFTNEIKMKENLRISHNVLRHIRIELGVDVTLDFLSLILNILPELRCLKLYYRFYCDYKQIADLLQTKLLRLKHFYFIVNENQFQSFPDLQRLKQMSFWFSNVKLEQHNNYRRIVCDVKK